MTLNIIQGHQKWHQSKASVWLPIIFIMKIVHEVQETKQKKKKSAKRCKVLVCAQAKNELFNVTESKVI